MLVLNVDIFEEVKFTRFQEKNVINFLPRSKKQLLPLIPHHFKIVGKTLNCVFRPLLKDRVKEENVHLLLQLAVLNPPENASVVVAFQDCEVTVFSAEDAGCAGLIGQKCQFAKAFPLPQHRQLPVLFAVPGQHSAAALQDDVELAARVSLAE